MRFFEQPTKWHENNTPPAPVCPHAEEMFLAAVLQRFSRATGAKVFDSHTGTFITLLVVRKYNGMNTALVVDPGRHHFAIAAPYGKNCATWLERWWAFTPETRVKRKYYLLRTINPDAVVSDALQKNVRLFVNDPHIKAMEFFSSATTQSIEFTLREICRIRRWG